MMRDVRPGSLVSRFAMAPLRSLKGYLKESMKPLRSAAVPCRGALRAAARRATREVGSRWREANRVSLPHRMKIVARLEQAKAARRG